MQAVFLTWSRMWPGVKWEGVCGVVVTVESKSSPPLCICNYPCTCACAHTPKYTPCLFWRDGIGRFVSCLSATADGSMGRNLTEAGPVACLHWAFGVDSWETGSVGRQAVKKQGLNVAEWCSWQAPGGKGHRLPLEVCKLSWDFPLASLKCPFIVV